MTNVKSGLHSPGISLYGRREPGPFAAAAEKNTKTGTCTRLLIKNMVSTRCMIVVKAALENAGLDCTHVELGMACVSGILSDGQHSRLNAALSEAGLELIRDRKEALAEKIKITLIEAIHYSDTLPKTKISSYLSEKLDYDYTYLANVFSEVTGSSIRQFIIRHKVERIKEMLLYEDLTLSQIAGRLQYSSVAYLSNQFKKNAGQPPSQFRKKQHRKLTALEDV